MEEYWTRIIKWLSKNASYMIDSINRGATSEDMQSIRVTIGAQLPNDFVDFYIIHNGQLSNTKGIINGKELLCTTRILEEWNIWKKLIDSDYFIDIASCPDRGIRSDWYNKLWIPITYDGAGNHYCLDLDPTDEGSYGQIIRVWHDNAQRSLAAPSFKKWIEDFVEDLETGRYK
ncbi:cell wall assembly regulator SMI1 [Dysgonomonas sp. PFB1-18]|uniref:SMI1/KNR4 family protein n=1 Tax=unclassified Dysgonomonas TaxID=2630389 RepID=UPI002475447D|nr:MULTISPECIES: SMI1/KNR4 family protein [unclassified Dysgonomonas]MDH6311231.1 cell wall assembly regulator SMI1 [Dysgonomonas sp. PF1-14]MDH6341127.1 cell wall assembly regulator SMI1 [Dysgonomonas sp. PF1-16]MDH6382822.1 cell wall assembly regulator SMI1 [Dysgonomonas sp. PFB1-18]MDH6400101.1 cell wall assembly regulator SMI1 [Dysgonomonas sp. PF1-23]